MEFFIQKIDNPANEEIDTCIACIQSVWENMTQPDWFAMDDVDVIKKRFEEKTAVLYTAHCTEDVNSSDARYDSDVMYNSDVARNAALAGLFMVTFPGLTEENLGWDLGFSKEDLLHTAHMDTAVVLPAYRGHGLQARFMQTAEADLRKMGYKYLLCTIHPENQFSMGNALKAGYIVEKTTEKYGGLKRNILCKRL